MLHGKRGASNEKHYSYAGSQNLVIPALNRVQRRLRLESWVAKTPAGVYADEGQ